jgi:hypothetical protein
MVVMCIGGILISRDKTEGNLLGTWHGKLTVPFAVLVGVATNIALGDKLDLLVALLFSNVFFVICIFALTICVYFNNSHIRAINIVEPRREISHDESADT